MADYCYHKMLHSVIIHGNNITARSHHLLFKHMYIYGHIPVLSAQLMTAPTGRPSEIRNFAPDEPPRPEIEKTS